MRKVLEIIIRENGYHVCHAGLPEGGEFIEGRELDLGVRLKELCEKHGIGGSEVTLYVGDESVFVKSIVLPANTSNVKEAIEYQLSLVTPFPQEDLLYSYTRTRKAEMLSVTIFAARKNGIENSVEQLLAAGYQLSGIFPESQRYVTSINKGGRWALVVPGQFSKVNIFDGVRLEDRLLCIPELSTEELHELCGTRTVYHVERPEDSDLQKTDELLGAAPFLKDYNMLPGKYRRPDYFRYIVAALIGFNVVALLVLGGINIYNTFQVEKKLDVAIAELQPQVGEMKKMQSRVSELEAYIDQIEEIAGNPPLFDFMDMLTQSLPENSYLDQLRMDSQQNAINIQGYTDNVSALTDALQEIGETKLKSTSRRKNKTYFQVEITLP